MQHGSQATYSTVHCTICTALYDILVVRHGYTVTEVPPRCPQNEHHVVVEWAHPGPCPKCGTLLTQQGLSEIWD